MRGRRSVFSRHSVPEKKCGDVRAERRAEIVLDAGPRKNFFITQQLGRPEKTRATDGAQSTPPEARRKNSRGNGGGGGGDNRGRACASSATRTATTRTGTWAPMGRRTFSPTATVAARVRKPATTGANRRGPFRRRRPARVGETRRRRAPRRLLVVGGRSRGAGFSFGVGAVTIVVVVGVVVAASVADLTRPKSRGCSCPNREPPSAVARLYRHAHCADVAPPPVPSPVCV